jgi:hypothetical protein
MPANRKQADTLGRLTQDRFVPGSARRVIELCQGLQQGLNVYSSTSPGMTNHRLRRENPIDAEER